MKKTFALVTLACFLVFSCSCIYNWKKTPIVSVKPDKIESVKICAVQVHSGEKVEFSKHPAAKIQGDSVVGTRFVKNFTLEKSKIKHPLGMTAGPGAKIMTIDGVLYTTTDYIMQSDSRVTFNAYFPGAIPLADVDFVWIRKFNTWANLLVFVAPPVAVFVAMAIAVSGGIYNSSGSLPWWDIPN